MFHIWFDGDRIPIKQMVEICSEYNLPCVKVYDYEYKIPNYVDEIVQYIDYLKSDIDGRNIE